MILLSISQVCIISITSPFLEKYVFFIISDSTGGKSETGRGSREREFEMRLEGSTYMASMNAGGGIHATTRMIREATEDKLMVQKRHRLDSFLQHGVTTVEGKSGYGLDLEKELKQLRVMKRLNELHSMDLVPTFMGAHAVSQEYKGGKSSILM